MCHSSLYPWQGFSGGENRHKQKGLLQKTDIHSIAQVSLLINQAHCGSNDGTPRAVSHLGEEQGRELSMYNVTLPYSRALLVRSDKISLHIRLMLFRESICRMTLWVESPEPAPIQQLLLNVYWPDCSGNEDGKCLCLRVCLTL